MKNRRNEKSRQWFGLRVHHFSRGLSLNLIDDVKDKMFSEYIQKKYGIKL